MSQVYMTAKLNLADGTILYPQVSLDNIVASISDPTLVTVATTTNGKVPVTELPVVTVVGDTGSNNNIPTEAAVRALADTKQNTLVAGTGTEIINGSTINAMAVNLNDVVVNNVPNNGLYLEVEGNTMSVVAQLAGATAGVPGTVMGATNGLAINGGVVTGVFGDGIEVVGNTAKVDIATMPEVLNGTADANIVDADGLRSAFSFGQAVDVSCAPEAGVYSGSGTSTVTYAEGGTFLDGFEWAVSIINGSVAYIGWYHSRFPKAGDDLRYLLIVDVKNKSTSASSAFIKMSATGSYILLAPGQSKRFVQIATPDSYDSIGWLLASQNAGTYSFTLEITNWRQYEVTSLTDETIDYISKLDNPDEFFRSTSFFDIVGRYLVKSDMVSPWTFLIPMKTNSASMTVGSGLAYKLSLTDGLEHEITVDTFPTDAYGADAHIQLLLSNNSTVVFKSPLNLIDPLTTNAANNITVKFRGGQANVYVDDTDAGYVVSVAGDATGAGSLYYGITGSTEAYIVFAKSINGNDIILPGGTVGRTFTLIGNGEENTIIRGDLTNTAGSGQYPSTTANNLTIYGAIASKNRMSLNSVTVLGATAVVVDPQTETNTRSLCVGSPQYPNVYNNCVFDSCVGGKFGVASLYGGGSIMNCVIKNCDASDGSYGAVFARNATVTGCTFSDNFGNSSLFCYTTMSTVSNCYFSDDSDTTTTAITVGWQSNYSNATITGCTFASPNNKIYVSRSCSLFLDGVNTLNNSIIVQGPASGYPTSFIGIRNGATIDLTGNTWSTVIYREYTSGASIAGCTVAVLDSNGTIGVAGTATVLYSSALDGELDDNNQPFIKSVTINGLGSVISRNILRANGGLGVPVGSTQAEQPTSLDTLIADENVMQITFSPGVDGQTCYVAGVSGATASTTKDLAINGAGMANTFIGSGTLKFDGSIAYGTRKEMYLYGFSATGLVVPWADWNWERNITVQNCHFTGASFVGEARRVHITGSTFKSITSTYAVKCGFLWMSDCVFDGCKTAIHSCYPSGNQYSAQYIKNCTFTNCSVEAVKEYYDGIDLVENCTFTNCVKPLNSYLGVSNAPDITIRNCTFNTATDKITLRCGPGKTVTYDNCTIKCKIQNYTYTSGGETTIFPLAIVLTGNTITGNIISASADDTIKFTGTNVMGSTVSGDGTVVLGGTVSGSSASHCVIDASTVTWLAGSNVDLNYVDITNRPASINLSVSSTDIKSLKMKNCTCATGAPSGSFPIVVNYGCTASLDNVVFSSTAGNGCYAIAGTLIMKNTTLACGAAVYAGTLVFRNTVTGYGFYAASNNASGKMVFEPGSIVTIQHRSGIEAMGTMSLIVGTYNDSTGEITQTGTATVILPDSTTVSISGSGTYIDSTGLH